MRYYKGNLHTHTTNSDGRMAPDDVLELYKSKGYDFIALTDHFCYNPSAFTDNMLIISGVEYDTRGSGSDNVYHIVGLGMKKDPGLQPKKCEPDILIDTIHNEGGLAVLAHPAWSMNKPNEAQVKCKNADMIEIYNTVSGAPFSINPDSGYFCDICALDGFIKPITAVDDSHFYKGDQCVSYIMVRAGELSEKAILESIVRGDFYATQGPELHYEVTGDTITVNCSPVDMIVFKSNENYVGDRYVIGENVTSAVYKMKPGEKWIRIELTDNTGKRAWSNYIVNIDKTTSL